MGVSLDTSKLHAGYAKIHIVGNATVAGLLGQVPNPEGVLLQIVAAELYVRKGAVGAATQNIGIGAKDADTSDLVSAFPMNKTDGTMWKVVGSDIASEAAATTPKGLLWAADKYLTVTNAAVASTGLDADLYVKYIRLED